MSFASYIEYIRLTLEKIDQHEIEKFISTIYKAYIDEKMIFIIGNGGSAANASHFAEDLTKGTCLSLDQNKRIKALSLTDNTPWLTALSNDDGYEIIFEQQLKTFAKKDDLLIAISGSGNSKNILKAVEWANSNGIVTIGVTGYNGGKLIDMVINKVHVPLNDMCSSESMHLLLFHYVIIELQKKIKDYLNNPGKNVY